MSRRKKKPVFISDLTDRPPAKPKAARYNSYFASSLTGWKHGDKGRGAQCEAFHTTIYCAGERPPDKCYKCDNTEWIKKEDERGWNYIEWD